MLSFKNFIQHQSNTNLIESLFFKSIMVDCLEEGNWDHSPAYMLSESDNSTLMSAIRKGLNIMATPKALQDINVLTGSKWMSELGKHAAEFAGMSDKEKKAAGALALERLSKTHGIKGLDGILAKNGKLEAGDADGLHPAKVPENHHLYPQHSGKTVSGYGVQGFPDMIDTEVGYVTTCLNPTGACRDNCLGKCGQNAIPAAIASKKRATYAAMGLSNSGGGQSSEDAESTRRAYVHAMLHGVRNKLRTLDRNRTSTTNPQNTVLAIRGGYMNSHMIDPLEHILNTGLTPEERDNTITSGYSEIRDPKNKRPNYIASIKGPGVKILKRRIPGKNPETGKKEDTIEEHVEYNPGNIESHRHLHSMISTMSGYDTKTPGKNGYAVLSIFRNNNPMFNPDADKADEMIRNISTMRFHHYNDAGDHIGHTDYDVKSPQRDGIYHDVRAIDPKNDGAHSRGLRGEHKGYVLLSSLSGLPAGQSPKTFPANEEGVRIPEHAHNAPFTLEYKVSDDGTGGKILHLHHPDTINKLTPEEKVKFGKNDSEFRNRFNTPIENFG